jgi:signal transduction histidine kinase/ferredoxin
MKHSATIPLVTTIKERCRVCYTCVRECPAKAIRIATGQAEVIPERCIGCGNCVRVCSQRAKRVLSAKEQVAALLADGEPVAAMVAPSFPAEFTECDARRLVGMLRAAGFAHVNEVAFGADLVARAYRDLLARGGGTRHIATSCPAVIGYVEKYYPQLVPALAPIVSPMVATARVLHRMYGEGLRTVFIGPCIAKKGEAASERIVGEVDAALTFVELREMLAERGIRPEGVAPTDFDPPHGCAGALFPIARGLLQAADVKEDLADGRVVAAEGRDNFVDALGEFASGDLDARLLEVLCCKGCIAGAGMSRPAAHFSRRSRVSQYVRRREAELDMDAWRKAMARFADLDLGREFAPNDQRIAVPLEEQLKDILARMGKLAPEDELNCGACGYDTCREHAVAIYKGLAENEMCLPHTIDQLKKTIQELAVSNDQLASTQEALMQSEKLASMGQLAAGIAHEVNNPLGVVLMYAHLLKEAARRDSETYGDLEMIVEQADRCKKIVAGLLHFARQNKVLLQPCDVGDLIARSLRAATVPAGVVVNLDHRTDNLVADVDRDQIIQVLTNLLSNACAAMPDGGTLTVSTRDEGERLVVEVADTGIGIPKEHLGKIFEPFFTTKQIGMGTGLGLAVTYGIVKMHRGDITLRSNADPAAGPTGTTFTVALPRKGQQD